MAGLLDSTYDGPKQLRELLAQGRPILAPGVYDALGARLVEEAGFSAVYMTGFAVSGGLLGRFDIGLATMTEMVDAARRIVSATNLPVVADADTGYGTPFNVIRTIREYERAGVAGVHIEDQTLAKKCGHMANKQIIPVDAMAAKITAAVAAKHDPDFVIIARTDARQSEGLEATIARARRYREAGADMIFISAPQGIDEYKQIGESLRDVPLFIDWVEGGRSPDELSVEVFAEYGFSFVTLPHTALLSTVHTVRQNLQHLFTKQTPKGLEPTMTTFADYISFIGLHDSREIEDKFGQAEFAQDGFAPSSEIVGEEKQ
jgi:2-methylisocitrate lyase-like PEP mutase family enzyme